MLKPQYHVQVLETAAEGEAFFPARELLPWADPYIASLMGQLEWNETQNADDTWVENEWADEPEPGDETGFGNELTPEPNDWHLDREPAMPPVYGGWPLLNDLGRAR
jgi:hypothetical protein